MSYTAYRSFETKHTVFSLSTTLRQLYTEQVIILSPLGPFLDHQMTVPHWLGMCLLTGADTNNDVCQGLNHYCPSSKSALLWETRPGLTWSIPDSHL